jgi:hypothetical protein
MARIPSYDEWVDRLTDEELERLELENTDLLTAYEDFVSDFQDEAYHQYKDDKLLDLI